MRKETKLRLRELVRQLFDIPRAAEIAKELNFAVTMAWTEGQNAKAPTQNQRQILTKDEISRQVKEQVDIIAEDCRNQLREKIAELDTKAKEHAAAANNAMAQANTIVADWWNDKYECCRHIDSLIIVGVGDISEDDAFDASGTAISLMAIDEKGSYKINEYYVLLRVSEHGRKMVVTVFTEDTWRKAKKPLVVGTVEEYITFANKMMKKWGYVLKNGTYVPKDIAARIALQQ